MIFLKFKLNKHFRVSLVATLAHFMFNSNWKLLVLFCIKNVWIIEQNQKGKSSTDQGGTNGIVLTDSEIKFYFLSQTVIAVLLSTSFVPPYINLS